MQPAFYMQNFGYGRKKQYKNRGYPVCVQANNAVPSPYFYPQGFPMQPYPGMINAGLNPQPQATGKATHPPVYKQLYKLWKRMQDAMTAGERKQVFQLCEQTHDFKVENKIRNSIIVLQNTFTQMLEQVANMQMDIVDNLDEEVQQRKTITPPLPTEETNQVDAEIQKEMIEEHKEIPQQKKKEEIKAKADEKEVVYVENAQQQIDDFGLTQQMQIQRLCGQIRHQATSLPRQRSVIEQMALMGRRVSGIKINSGRSKPVKEPNKGSDNGSQSVKKSENPKPAKKEND